MTMALNGTTQWAHIASNPSASAFVVAAWFRRTGGTSFTPFAISDGSFFNASYVDVEAASTVVSRHAFSTSASAFTLTTDVWYWVMLKFDGSTLTLRSVADGDSAWATNVTQTSLSALTQNQMAIGARYSDGTERLTGQMALVKVWSGTLPSDAEVLAERLSTNVTVTTGIWSAYDFLTGALATDRSGNSRTLTLAGTPTYTADKPTDLTIGSAGPTITVQPSADVVLINGDPTRASASFTVSATGTGTILYDWELEDGVGSGVYANVADGSGATWTGQAAQNLTATFTVKTLTGRRVRCNVTDDNGTTTSDAVTLTVYTGPVISKTSGTTNGSGVDTLTIVSDYPNGVGEFTTVTATAGGVTKTVALDYQP